MKSQENKMDIRTKCESIWEREDIRDHDMNSLSGGSAAGSQMSQYERNLNFATAPIDDGEYGFPKKKTIRDPLSHRIIEKRRRDRMNNCLADLARLLPQASLRKGRGRIEKTEIVELAIKHLRHLQTHPCPHGDSCELNPTKPTGSKKSPSGQIPSLTVMPPSPSNPCSFSLSPRMRDTPSPSPVTPEAFKLGFQGCLSEALRFILESKGAAPISGGSESYSSLCVELAQHLNHHFEKVYNDNSKKRGLSNGYINQGSEAKLKQCCGSVVSPGYRPNGTSSSGSDGNAANDGDLGSIINPAGQYYNERHIIECDTENQSCSSTPLSIEVSDVLSSDGRNNCNGHSSNTLTIPTGWSSKHSPNTRNSGSPGGCTSVSNCRSSDEGHDAASPTSSRYKFKNTIKQRFTADSQTKTEPDTESNSSFSRTEHGFHSHEDRGRDFEESEREVREGRDQLVSSPGSDGMPEMSTCRNAFIPRVSVVDLSTLAESEDPEPNPSQNVRGLQAPLPAFVLHEKRGFYIPLTIDRSLIKCEAFPDDPECQTDQLDQPFPLHPVTISVCYAINKNIKIPTGGLALATDKRVNVDIITSGVSRSPSKYAKSVEDIRDVRNLNDSPIDTPVRYVRLHPSLCQGSDVSYQNFSMNQHILQLENNGGLSRHDHQPSIFKVDSKSVDNSELSSWGAGATVLRKSSNSDTKSAFVGYKSWRRNAEHLAVPTDFSLKTTRNFSSSFRNEIEQVDNPSPKIRKFSSTEFNPRIVDSNLCLGQPKLARE